MKQRAHSLRDRIKELSRRGDIRAIGYNISKAFDEGLLKEKTGLLLDLLNTILQNLSRKKKEKRYSASTKGIFEVLFTMGGARLCELVSENLEMRIYIFGGHKENILAIAQLYKKMKETMCLKDLHMPYIKAEDVTAIIPGPEYKVET